MTGIKKEYELRVFDSTGGAVDFTVASSNMRRAPTINGPAIDLARMRTQARPSQVEILDVDDYFSAKIADSSGRLILLGRKCDVRVNKDGAGMSVLQTGRISDIVDHVSHFNLTFEDERYIERKTTVFTKQDGAPSTVGNASSSHYTGTILWPAGPSARYGDFKPRDPLGFQAQAEDRFGTLVGIQFLDIQKLSRGFIPVAVWNDSIRDLVRRDVSLGAFGAISSGSTEGAFRNLRLNIDSTDYEIAAFGFSADVDSDPAEITFLPPAWFTTTLDPVNMIWVVDPSTTIADGDSITSAYLHMPSAEPHPLAPLHIGGTAGMHPVQLVKDLYDAAGVSYSSSGIDDLILDQTFGTVRFRITQPENLAGWLEDHIYGPYGLIPFINSSGEVEPKRIHLQQNVDPDTLFSFTAKNSVAPHPEPHHTGRDMVTAIKFTYAFEGLIRPRLDSGNWAADGIRVTPIEIERTHDRLDSSELPRRELRFQLTGKHIADFTLPTTSDDPARHFSEADRLADVLSNEIFERYGDGPLSGTIRALSTAETVDAGDFASINIPTFLAPSTQGRGAKRIVQITSRVDTPAGPDFDWLDAGPHSQPLSALSITVAQATSDSKHTIIATVSSLDTKAEHWQIQRGRGSTEPGSSAWEMWVRQGASSGAFSIGPLASNSTYWFRARATATVRVRSDWSTAATAQTAQIAQPGVSSSTGETATSIQLQWAVNTAELRYPLTVRISSSGKTCPSSSTMDLVGRLQPGSNQFEFRDLTSDSTYCLGVRHYDIYGGVGAERTLTAATTTTTRSLPDMKQKPTIMAGSTCA